MIEDRRTGYLRTINAGDTVALVRGQRHGAPQWSTGRVLKVTPAGRIDIEVTLVNGETVVGVLTRRFTPTGLEEGARGYPQQIKPLSEVRGDV